MEVAAFVRTILAPTPGTDPLNSISRGGMV
jgi:hypothetical protein